MTKIRNPEARCENCPYWLSGHPLPQGVCLRFPPPETLTYNYAFCGEHPDFLIDAPEPLDKPE